MAANKAAPVASELRATGGKKGDSMMAKEASKAPTNFRCERVRVQAVCRMQLN